MIGKEQWLCASLIIAALLLAFTFVALSDAQVDVSKTAVFDAYDAWKEDPPVIACGDVEYLYLSKGAALLGHDGRWLQVRVCDDGSLKVER